MALLTNLSTELLDHILSYSCVSHKVIDLWKCGNGRLNTLLANGGCTRVLLKDEKWNSTSRWPKMLRFLCQLKSLAISRIHFRLMDACELGKELQQLSPSIEELSLECAEAESCFLAFNDISGLTMSDEADLKSQLESKSSQDAALSLKTWSVGEKYPNLKSLVLLASEASLPNEWIEQLPISLTKLEMHAEGRYDAFPVAIALPRSLHSFTGSPSMKWTAEAYQSLPPTLSTCPNGISLVAEHEKIALLPRTIMSMNDPVSVSPLLMHVLPTHITDLSVSWLISEPPCSAIPTLEKFESIWFHYLPRTLTSLNIGLNTAASQLVISWLPRTITRLHLAVINWSLNTPDPCFPPHLDSLSVQFGDYWTLDQWRLLSHNKVLRELDVGPNVFDTEFLMVLPPTLTHFRCAVLHLGNSLPALQPACTALMDLSVSTPFHPSSIACLPRTLTRANLWFSDPIESEHARNWPSTLKHLRMHPTPQQVLCAPLFALPASLRDLEVSILYAKPTREDLEVLPRQLETLCIAQRTEGVQTSEEDLLGLPPCLTSLEWNPVPMNPSCLACLPDTLTYFDVQVPTVEDQHLTKLPRDLRSAHLFCLVPTVSGSWLQHAPQHLEIFNTDIGWEGRQTNLAASRKLRIDALPLVTPDPRVTKRYE